MPKRDSTQVLIIGAGPAGLAAANAAADAGAKVLVVDEQNHPGGQIWRAKLGRPHPNVNNFLRQIDSESVRFLPGATVFDLDPSGRAMLSTAEGRTDINFESVILATGARELFLPFPGWTLNGVLGAGGLQALVKSGHPIEGARVVVAGSGPLNIEVARFLMDQGAQVLAVFEQTPTASLAKFSAGILKHGQKLRQAMSMTKTFAKVKPDRWVVAAFGQDRVEGIAYTDGAQQWQVEVDYLACAYGLVPNIELAQLIGCRIQNGFVSTDKLQQTTVERVYCAGEPTMIGGLDGAIPQGVIAGYAAAGKTELPAKVVSDRETGRRFARLLKDCFALREEVLRLADNDTIVCRCEDVRYGDIAQSGSAREAKIYHRCGMGPCQGRICGPATQLLFGWEPPHVRPPVVPVPIQMLIEDGELEPA